MTPRPPDKRLDESVDRRREQEERGRREGDRPLALNLAMIGSLGWLVVVPTLGGVFLGQWLDRHFDTGLDFTGAMLMVGVAFGSFLAWQRVQSS